ncbi:MAG: transposase [Myxacorys chilensis ATA2-1-KO14]|nr:transposase [Myxacorys chilensis ATA2-1-KO14]
MRTFTIIWFGRLVSTIDSYVTEFASIYCICFAPNAPEQNPIEDVWLQAKNYLRQRYIYGLATLL